MAKTATKKKVEIYSTPTCVYCDATKSFLKKNGIDYVEYNVASDIIKRAEMLDKSGQMGVPVTDINGEIVVGFDEKALAEKLGVK